MTRLFVLVAGIVVSLAGAFAQAQSMGALTAPSVFKARFETLAPQQQKEAEILGYTAGDLVRLSRGSEGGLAVLPPSRLGDAPQAEEFELSILRVLPPSVPGGPSVIAAHALFDTLPEDIRKVAVEAGYQPGSRVRFTLPAGGNVLDILPPFAVGSRAFFGSLSADDRTAARAAGYAPGDDVWFRVTDGGKVMVPANDAIGGPVEEPLQTSVGMSQGARTARTTVHRQFDFLDEELQAAARKSGYGDGDEVTIHQTLTVRPDGQGETAITIPSRDAWPEQVTILPGTEIKRGNNRSFKTPFETLNAAKIAAARAAGYADGEDVGVRWDPRAKFTMLSPAETARLWPARPAASPAPKRKNSSNPLDLIVAGSMVSDGDHLCFKMLFEDLAIERQIVARARGYKEGDAVPYRIVPGGTEILDAETARRIWK